MQVGGERRRREERVFNFRDDLYVKKLPFGSFLYIIIIFEIVLKRFGINSFGNICTIKS